MLIKNPVKSLLTARKLSIVSDSVDFLSECRKLGFLTHALKKGIKLPRHSVAFSFSDEAARLIFETAKITPVRKCIFCPLHVFDVSVGSALYTLSLILKSDFIEALNTQGKILSILKHHKSLHLVGEHSMASVVIKEDSTPYAMIKSDLEENFIHSVAEFFEVHYAHMNAGHPCPFSIEGYLKVSGILSARRSKHVEESKSLEIRIEKLIKSISVSAGSITIENNQIVSLKNADGEHLELLEQAAGTRRLSVTEFAIGVNRSIQPLINYAVNSQLNEGIEGVHLAIGDGSTGYHIDFLSPGVTAVPI